MVFSSSLCYLSLLAIATNLRIVAGQAPVQTYFVPLPEDDLLRDVFRKVSTTARGNVNSFTSIAIAATGTVIWYDHWEDGYDFHVTKPSQETTEIWGDGDCDNGFAPYINGVPNKCENPSDDFLTAGNAITLDNDVILPRDRKQIFYDGSDKIQSSFPLAMTRGAFPRTPGSFLAGAVEVLNTESWGTHFVTPVGRTTVSGTEAFEWSALFVMAAVDGTEVTLPNGSTEILRQGQNLGVLRVREGEEVKSTHPIQVVLLAGDRQSVFELRWYSLTPVTEWGTEYYTPVGTGTNAETGVWLYNPGPDTIDVTYTFFGGETGTIPGIKAKEAVLSPNIPDGSGARFTSTNTFYGITQTETGPSGDNYDWGHPLIPVNLLTSQALVGWGYGCTDNQCVREGIEYSVSRSVVFVTPVADAVIKVDFDNDGVVDEVITGVKAMQSIKVVAPDEDMTGALVLATTTEESEEPVKIAVAWGQDPARSGLGDSGALDLGTSVPPLPLLEAGKSTVLVDDRDGNDVVTPGDVLEYTIRIANIGQVTIPSGAWNVIDYALPLFESTSYVPGTTTYSVYDRNNQLLRQEFINDDFTGSAFPLDEGGIASIDEIEARGGSHELKFQAVILGVDGLTPGSFSVSNTGVITLPGSNDPLDKFDDTTGYSIFPTLSLEVCSDDGCGPLLSTSGPAGQYCAEKRGDNLEVEVTVTEPSCQLFETHLCNLPYLSDENLNTPSHTLVIPSDEAYAFACGFDEETFVVAGHATISCDDGTGGSEVHKNTYFEIELCCEEIYPSGFEPPEGVSGPWAGPGSGTGGVEETPAPVVVPTNAPVKSCDYECPVRANRIDEEVCPESFDDCVCKDGFKPNAANDNCINDCDAFVCPPNSTPKDPKCVRFMRDCICDPGYVPANDLCLVPS